MQEISTLPPPSAVGWMTGASQESARCLLLLQDLLLESQASCDIDNIFLSNKASRPQVPYLDRPVTDLNTTVSSPPGSLSEDMEVIQTNVNMYAEFIHSDLLSQAVQEIYSLVSDTVISDSSEQLPKNIHEPVMNSTITHNSNASLMHKLDFRNVQLYNQCITIINMQDELLEFKRALCACHNDKINWQLSATHLEQDLQLKEYRLLIANKMHAMQNEKIELAHQFIDAQNLQITTLSKQLYQLRITHKKVKQDLRTLQTQRMYGWTFGMTFPKLKI